MRLIPNLSSVITDSILAPVAFDPFARLISSTGSLKDIASAFYKLSEAKQNILRIRFSTENNEWALIAKDLNTTPDGARMKVQRTIASLIRNLGGWKPQPDDDLVEADDDERGE